MPILIYQQIANIGQYISPTDSCLRKKPQHVTMKTEFVTLDLWIQLWWVVVTHSQHSEMCFRKSRWKQGFCCMGTYEKDKINIQAANRREEKRQAGCHTSKTGTQLQQTAEITEHGGKRNRRCERCSNKDTDTIRIKLFIAKLVRQFMQSEHICAWILPTLHWNVISNKENIRKLWMKMKAAGPCDGQFRVILYCGRKKPFIFSIWKTWSMLDLHCHACDNSHHMQEKQAHLDS